MADRTAQVLVTATELDGGDLKLNFQGVGKDSSWAVEWIAGLIYGDGSDTDLLDVELR